MSVRVLADAEALAAAAAGATMAALSAGIARAGAASVVISGGRTPVGAFRRMAAIFGDWNRVGIWFADERAVSPNDIESNYRLARDMLIQPARIPPERVHRMAAERPDIDRAAEIYEAGFPSRVDLVMLGIGEDGHVASLFPHAPQLRESTRRIAVVRNSPKPPPLRMTITPRVLAEAGAVLVLASGPDKADAVARALAEQGDIESTPARLVRDRDWLVDAAAASKLPGLAPGGP